MAAGTTRRPPRKPEAVVFVETVEMGTIDSAAGSEERAQKTRFFTNQTKQSAVALVF